MDTGKGALSTMGRRCLGFEGVFTPPPNLCSRLWQQRSKIEDEDEFEDEDDWVRLQHEIFA
jgi:hypothetical protein